MFSSIFNSKVGQKLHLKFFAVATLIALPAIVILRIRVPRNVEPYYVRFTTPPRPSLILGTSRGAQGLVPSEIESGVGEQFAKPLLNFSFTASHSRWGPSYYKAFLKKLSSDSKPGLFILEVSPLSLVVDKLKKRTFGAQFSTLDREDLLPESNKGLLNCLKFMNLNPNLDYVRCRHSRALFELFYRPLPDRSPVYNLRQDGWLEVSLDSLSKPEERIAKARKHEKMLRTTQWSTVREHWLKKSIIKLKEYGSVYMVRLPTDLAFKEAEDASYGDFDQRMQEISKELNTPYFNYMLDAGKYRTTEGSHLYRVSSRMLSADLGLKISKEASQTLIE